jgi:hypothetical protein
MQLSAGSVIVLSLVAFQQYITKCNVKNFEYGDFQVFLPYSKVGSNSVLLKVTFGSCKFFGLFIRANQKLLFQGRNMHVRYIEISKRKGRAMMTLPSNLTYCSPSVTRFSCSNT